MGGRFCLSDDSHGTAQVGLNYHRVLSFIEKTGIQEVYYLEHIPSLPETGSRDMTPASSKASMTSLEQFQFDSRFPNTALRRIDLATLKAEPFWKHFS